MNWKRIYPTHDVLIIMPETNIKDLGDGSRQMISLSRNTTRQSHRQGEKKKYRGLDSADLHTRSAELYCLSWNIVLTSSYKAGK